MTVERNVSSLMSQQVKKMCFHVCADTDEHELFCFFTSLWRFKGVWEPERKNVLHSEVYLCLSAASSKLWWQPSRSWHIISSKSFETRQLHCPPLGLSGRTQTLFCVKTPCWPTTWITMNNRNYYDNELWTIGFLLCDLDEFRTLNQRQFIGNSTDTRQTHTQT